MNYCATSTDEVSAYQEEYGFNLLIEEPPLQVLPSLAEAIGLEESIVIQQMHYFLRKGSGKEFNGHRWLFNTYEQWKTIFPFWSERTIRRIFTRLESMHLVESCQPEGRMSRRKYYRLNQGMMSKIRKGAIKKPDVAKLAASNRPEWPLPITETTPIESKETKESPFPSEEGDTDFEPKWNPVQGTKEEKLRKIKTPTDYPSEREFNSFLTARDPDGFIETYRPDLYSTLCDQKWHKWTEHLGKWVRIRDWRAFVVALRDKLEICMD